MPRPTTRPRTVVNDPSEIPEFASEEDEVAFWDTHSVGPGMIDYDNTDPDPLLDAIPKRPRTRPVPVRFDDDTMARLKAVAASKGIGYQTMLKSFVMERLYEEEKRAGIVGQ
jgi:hypothetical protein